ncbi:MAG: lytic transglycosylase domain-containing protein [Magnetospirillum sp.]|nr:lytic transglycosylase domain-containing protein [Magnetospirillum sp.]
MGRLNLLAAALGALLAALPAQAQSERWRPLVAEAAHRFDIPEGWIDAVMAAESGGDPRAVSPKGAIGLMQLMPATWAELRPRHGLGDDHFDPRANILAGAAYLRQMRDRFGMPGAFAAYHAGPGRYREHLLTGRPLPSETRAYLAALASALPSGGGLFVPLRSQPAGLFVPLATVSGGRP